jgi:hypothetical protein
VLRYLDACGVEYRLVPTLVRGLDYYTRTTFEFMASALGAALSLAGGGRYDYLIEEIGGPQTPPSESRAGSSGSSCRSPSRVQSRRPLQSTCSSRSRTTA